MMTNRMRFSDEHRIKSFIKYYGFIYYIYYILLYITFYTFRCNFHSNKNTENRNM